MRADREQLHGDSRFKKNGHWLLDSVRETESTTPAPGAKSPLKQVAWLVGQWIDEEPNVTVTYDCRWSKNETFLISNFTIVAAGGVDMQGTQIIGWDPAEQSLRVPWVFDSDGRFGTGLWSHDGNEWVVKMRQVLARWRPRLDDECVRNDRRQYLSLAVDRPAGRR